MKKITFTFVVLLLMSSLFFGTFEGNANSSFYDGKVTLSDAIYSLQVVSGSSSAPETPILIGQWNVTGNMVQIPDYTLPGPPMPPIFINDFSGYILHITEQVGNVFGGFSTNSFPGDGNTIYVTGVIQGDQVTIQERHLHTWHIWNGRYTSDGLEERMEGTFYGNEDTGTPPSSAESGTFVAIKAE